MTAMMKWIALAATFTIIVVIPIYVWFEPSRQQQQISDNRIQSVVNAEDLYADDCVVCHGASGEGIATNPALNTEAIRNMSSTELTKVIARGRFATLMPPWAVEEGGVLSNSEVDDLVALIQYGNWEFVEGHVAELGLTPPQVIELEVSDEMLASLQSLPDGNQLGDALTIYEQRCAACHNANGSGTLIAPAIDSSDLRVSAPDDLAKLITNGVPGTLMAGWDKILTLQQVESLVKLINNWPLIIQAGIEFPDTEMSYFPSSPEMIAAGEQLFNIACKSCHGVEAYGSPMAPALNNQIFLSQTPDAAIYQIVAGGVPGTRMPTWGNRLTDEEIHSLVVYLRSLEISAPPILPPILDGG